MVTSRVDKNVMLKNVKNVFDVFDVIMKKKTKIGEVLLVFI